MPKKIVICCDGTGNELAEDSSNVVKLCQVLVKDDSRQVIYYNPGLGTVPVPSMHTRLKTFIRKFRGLGFGYGITEDIKRAYRYLMNTYEEGDEVYLFGFSRGAYTARALAGMVHCCGVIHKGNDPLVDYAYKAYRECFRGNNDERFKQTFGRECKPRFLGVWDTVASVGLWPEAFPFTFKNPGIEVIRHAIAIDERRAKFRTNLFPDKPAPGQDIRQVWFAGVHSDVGGGYPAGQTGLADAALRWMLNQSVEYGLLVDPAKVAALTPPDLAIDIHKSLSGIWWLLEWIPLRRWNSTKGAPEWISYRSSPRPMPANSRIHQSVLDRMALRPDYQPPNLTVASCTVEP